MSSPRMLLCDTVDRIYNELQKPINRFKHAVEDDGPTYAVRYCLFEALVAEALRESLAEFQADVPTQDAVRGWLDQLIEAKTEETLRCAAEFASRDHNPETAARRRALVVFVHLLKQLATAWRAVTEDGADPVTAFETVTV